MEEAFFTVGSFLVALAILITVHEFGHFWVARKLGVRVLRFSVGFGRPLVSWFSRRDGTEYAVAAIPLGGYVKMLDEREGEVAASEVHLAFNRQRLWKRFAIVSAGPIFNLLFAILVYWGILIVGDTGTRPIVGKVEPNSIAAAADFAPGDEILAVGDRKTPTWEAAVFALMSDALDPEDTLVRVREKNGAEAVRVLDEAVLSRLPENPSILDKLGLEPARPVVPPIIGELVAGDPAEEAGLHVGDRVAAVNGEAVKTWGQWVEIVQKHPGQALRITVERGNEKLPIDLVPRRVEGPQGSIGRIGAGPKVPEGLLDQYRAVVRLGPLDALGASVRKTVDMSGLMLRVMGKMLIGQASVKNLSGPISIAETAGKTASYGLHYFVKFLAVVSISLGILNLMPIPVLDGGHLLYFTIEGVKGSPLSENAQLQGQRIGLALLAALMTLAFYVDIARLLG
jgi:regulator of sigma E protease